MVFSLRSLLLVAGVALADLTCAPYIPRQAKTSFGAIQFSSGGDLVLYYVVKAANPAVLKSEPDFETVSNGTIFHFETCISKSLNFGQDYDNGECKNGFQLYTYYDSLRVVNNATGHCLSTRPAKEGPNRTVLFFEACDPNPTTTKQIFRTYQTDDGHCPRTTPGSINPPGFLSFEYAPKTFGNAEDLVPSPWIFGTDQRTLEYLPKKQGNGNNLQALLIIN